MNIFVASLIAMVACLHFYFLILEMFWWSKPVGLRVFRQSEAEAKSSAALAANQGLYNGFLAVGLFWGLFQPVAEFAFQIKIFFLACVVVAGAYGAWSVSRRILWIQAAPAVLALSLLFLSRA